MTTAYFDCFAGAGGDMIVGALVDAGCGLDVLAGLPARLGLESCTVKAEKVNRGGIAATKFTVEAGGEQPARTLPDILRAIDGAGLAPRAAERARRIFQRLGEAEAKVHGVGLGRVHFHEVGAADSMMDIVGACVALEALGVDSVLASAVPVGSGTVRTDHGALPVPAPATAELLVGALTRGGELAGEVLTPTAAAILAALCESFGPMPSMRVSAVGYGAGTRSGGPLPNVVRVFVGVQDEGGQADEVFELSCNLDDCSGQVIAAAMDDLLSAGCLDAWAAPIVMKKSRPAYMLSAICAAGDVAKAEAIMFCQTPTFGVRRRSCARSKLLRRHEVVQTAYGPVRVKVGRLGERDVTATPEFADCQAAAESHGVSVRQVIEAAAAAYARGQ